MDPLTAAAVPEAPLDVLTMGRIGVDLYPEQIGVPLRRVRTFRKMLGGSPTNVAVASSRLGLRAGVISAVGDDAFGLYVKDALVSFGVRAVHLGRHPSLRTPLTFCEVFPPDDFPLLFYREPKAPDLELTFEDVDLVEVTHAGVFWTTGTGLSAEPSRSATLAALAARGRARHTIHDLDHRPVLWGSEADARRWALEALAHATVAVGNEAEVAMAVGRRPPLEAAAALLDLGVEIAIVKLGPRGVLIADRDGSTTVPPIPVEVCNGLGAGDAFGGGLCLGLRSGWSVRRMVEFANACGALVASRLGCADDMPDRNEVDAFLEEHLARVVQ